MGLRGWERQTVRKKGAKGQHGSTPLYQTALYCSLLLNVSMPSCGNMLTLSDKVSVKVYSLRWANC